MCRVFEIDRFQISKYLFVADNTQEEQIWTKLDLSEAIPADMMTKHLTIPKFLPLRYLLRTKLY